MSSLTPLCQGVSSGSLLPCSYSEVRLDPEFKAYVQVRARGRKKGQERREKSDNHPSSTAWVRTSPAPTSSPCLTTPSSGPWTLTPGSRNRSTPLKTRFPGPGQNGLLFGGPFLGSQVRFRTRCKCI